MSRLLLLVFVACAPTTPKLGDSTSPPDDSGPSQDSGLTDSGSNDSGVTDSAQPADPLIVINEIMAANEGIVVDEDGLNRDWIELYNAGDRAVDLSGFGVSDAWTEPLLWTVPAGTELAAGGHLVIWAGGDGEEDPSRLPFSLARDGEGVGVFTADGRSLDWVLFPAMEADTAWARIPDGTDTWSAVLRGTPGSSNAEVTLVSAEPIVLGHTWHYWDQGEDLGVTWREVGYDHTGWPRGAAPLGYGEAEATTLSYGPDGGDKHPTTYFRTTFELASMDNLYDSTLTLLVDDGALVWLNGVELLRVNLDDGDVGFDTYANYTVSGGDEGVYQAYNVDASALTTGENTLAVEVHQASADSSDLQFDLSLSLMGWTTP